MYDQKTRILVGMAAIAALAVTGVAAVQREKQDHQSVAGQWILSAEGGPHPIKIRLGLEQDGTKVTGSVENPHGGSDFRVSGTLVARKLALAAVDGTDLELSGELKDDGTMAGVMSTARGDLEWVAKRAGGR
jgi:hypothetical protein